MRFGHVLRWRASFTCASPPVLIFDSPCFTEPHIRCYNRSPTLSVSSTFVLFRGIGQSSINSIPAENSKIEVLRLTRPTSANLLWRLFGSALFAAIVAGIGASQATNSNHWYTITITATPTTDSDATLKPTLRLNRSMRLTRLPRPVLLPGRRNPILIMACL